MTLPLATPNMTRRQMMASFGAGMVLGMFLALICFFLARPDNYEMQIWNNAPMKLNKRTGQTWALGGDGAWFELPNRK